MDAKSKKEESSWDLASGYDPDEFYMGVTNKRGEGATVYLKMSAGTAGAIAALVQSGRFPYRTSQDFLRDAAVHRLQWCEDKGKVDLPIMRAERQLSIIQQQAEKMQMIETTYREYERTIRLAKDNNDWHQVSGLTSSLATAAMELPEPHATRFQRLAADTEANFPAAYIALLESETDPEAYSS